MRRQEQETNYIRVRVKAGSKNESAKYLGKNLWEICVQEKAEHGAANVRAQEVLARVLGVESKRLLLAKGRDMPQKTFLLR